MNYVIYQSWHNITILTGYPNYPIGEIYEVFLKDKKKFNNYKAKVIRVPILPRKKNKLTLSLNLLVFFLVQFSLAT